MENSSRLAVLAAAAAAAVFILPMIIIAVIVGGSGDDSVCAPLLGGDVAQLASQSTDALDYVTPDHAATILATIRHRESGNNYQAVNRGDGVGDIASGAYQFVTTTWNNFGGFHDAYEAPPDVQDQKAIGYLGQALAAAAAKGLDWTFVPVYWYQGHIPAELDYIPAPGEGNTQTLAEYRAGWLADFEAIAAGEIPAGDPAGGCAIAGVAVGVAGPAIDAPNGAALPAVDQIALPDLRNPHANYPAIDLMLTGGTPLYAWSAGQVINTTDYPYRCDYGAGRDACKPNTCGVGVTVRHATWPDVVWTYCHLQQRFVNEGDVIPAGYNVGSSGQTGWTPGGYHLHFEMRTGDTKRCVQPLLVEIFTTGRIIDPHGLPTSGCFF